MIVQKHLLTPGAERGRSGRALSPRGVVVHWVGNAGSTAINNRNYFERGSDGRKVSYHYIVGLEGEIIQCVPENERAAHAGADANGKYIGIGTCHPKMDGKFADATYRSLVALTADICKRHALDAERQVLRHYDCTGKACPLYFTRYLKEWQNFKRKVAAEMGGFLLKMVELGVINSPDYWRDVNVAHLDALFEKAAAPGILDKSINNGISNLDDALRALTAAGVVNSPDYWRNVAQNVKYTDILLINIANRVQNFF
jgi:N-acetylmuramoyl-L-alanine amidase